MMPDSLHISKLRCEPHKIHPSHLGMVLNERYYGPPEGYTFWRIHIDDELLTDYAQPFLANDPTIELFGNIAVPFWGDGKGYVSVRRIGKYIIWCEPLEDGGGWFSNHPGL